MGKSSKEVTIGYKYYVGMHMILTQGVADKLVRIRVAEREVWSGTRLSGQVSINKPAIFGGDSREGGIAGTLDFETGLSTQEQNSYLLSKIGSVIPAFRKVTGVVLNQMYMGNNPYLKNWDFRLQRIHTRYDDLQQWYDKYSEIRLGSGSVEQSFCFAIDTSTSMSTIVYGTTTRLDVVKDAVVNILSYIGTVHSDANTIVNIGVCLWNSSSSTLTKNNASAADIIALQTFVQSATTSGGTDFELPFTYANSFFDTIGNGKQRIMFFITDGEPDPIDTVDNAVVTGSDILDPTSGSYSYDNNTQVDAYAINIDLTDTQYTDQVQNQRGAIVADSSVEDQLYNIIKSCMGPHGAMNAVHIIRECLTDPDWGMGYGDADIGDSFESAAETIFYEGFGLCLLWDKQSKIEDFIEIVKKHINAELYVDRTTGKWEIKLIREDYNTEELVTLNYSNIQSVTDFSKPIFGELTNAVTVNYWNLDISDTSTLTVQDIALAEEQNNAVQTTVDYIGVVTSELASRLAQRDLKTLSSALISCTLNVTRIAKTFNPGTPFILNWPEYGVNNAVMRVTGIDFGTDKSKIIKVQCIEDVFSMPDKAIVGKGQVEWIDPLQDPIPITNEIAFEVPYLELIQIQAQINVDDSLSLEPDLGYVAAAAARPTSNSLSARLYTDSGAGYVNYGNLDFCPSATLAEDIDKMATSFTVTNANELEEAEVGSWLQIGNELMSYEDLTGDTLTVKRAVLDTVPALHSTDDNLLFWDAYAEGDPTQYVKSDSVNVKLLTVTGSGELALADATEETVVLNSRAFRPYPPANVKFNGTYFIDTQIPADTDVIITWNSRNRVQQTGGVLLGFTDDSVTPEDGTTYKIVFTDLDTSTELETITGITDLTYTMLYSDYPTSINIKVELYSVRDTYDSLYAVEHNLNIYREVAYIDNLTIVSFVKPPLAASIDNLTIVSFVQQQNTAIDNLTIVSFVQQQNTAIDNLTIVSFVKAP